MKGAVCDDEWGGEMCVHVYDSLCRTKPTLVTLQYIRPGNF